MSDLKVNEVKTDTIKNQAGTSAMTINTAGIVTTGVKHAFYMYRSAFQSITHASGFNLIQFDATRVNEGSGVTLGASARYTVPVNAGGLYLLHGFGRLETGTDGNASVQIRLNGTAIGTTYYYNGYYDGMNLSLIRSLSAGDYIEMGITNSVGVTVNVGGADAGDSTYCWGYRLG